MTHPPAITVTNLSKTYLLYDKPSDRLKQALFGHRRHYYKEFLALRPLSFEVRKGEAVGIIGRNGSGKSTLLQLICGTLTPSSGTVAAMGKVSALLELGAGFNPDFTGHENIYLNAAILGLTREETDAKYDAIVSFADIGEHIFQPVKTYSSGMYVRLAFAVAIAVEPDILVVDEALAVGDAIFQRKCFSRIHALKERGATILFVSHAMNTVVELCDRAILLDHGEYLLAGEPKDVAAWYHKLIFAPADKAEKVRGEIREVQSSEYGVQNSVKKETVTELRTPNSGHSYLPDLIPESTLVHESRGLHLTDAYITDLAGNRANVLTRRERYRLQYTATFETAHRGARFNFFISSITGTMLAGGNTQPYDEALREVAAGGRFRVTFEFTCHLLPGDYYIMLGCSGLLEDSRAPLARVADALMFRIPPEPGLAINGLVDLGIEGSFAPEAV